MDTSLIWKKDKPQIRRAASLETFREMSNKSNRLLSNSPKVGKSQVPTIAPHKSTSLLFLIKITVRLNFSPSTRFGECVRSHNFISH